jgi:hypothetical protein
VRPCAARCSACVAIAARIFCPNRYRERHPLTFDEPVVEPTWSGSVTRRSKSDEVHHLAGMLRRGDEVKVMPIIQATSGERHGVVSTRHARQAKKEEMSSPNGNTFIAFAIE